MKDINDGVFFIGGSSGSSVPPMGKMSGISSTSFLPQVVERARQQFGVMTSAFGVVSGKEGIFIDNGTGAAAVAEWFMRLKIERIWGLQTHFHHDHVLGIHGNGNLYRPTEGIYAPELQVGKFQDIYDSLFTEAQWPVSPKRFGLNHQFHDFMAGADLPVMHGVKTMLSCHPGGSALYRIALQNGDVVIATDIELADAEFRHSFADFISGARTVYLDVQYRESEYLGFAGICGGPKIKRIGWGHSTPAMARETFALVEKKPQTLIIGHHDPARTDEDLAYFREEITEELAPLGMTVEMGEDGYPHRKAPVLV